jgi:hypothetical protein
MTGRSRSANTSPAIVRTRATIQSANPNCTRSTVVAATVLVDSSHDSLTAHAHVRDQHPLAAEPAATAGSAPLRRVGQAAPTEPPVPPPIPPEPREPSAPPRPPEPTEPPDPAEPVPPPGPIRERD